MIKSGKIERGKFCSLTLINWNGFFARTFDLDEWVTTLSGGNGAGKSTTMAAFITALIPDLTLLHFRNTTEAGSTTGSRDKGLHGKLRAGVCYSALYVMNSRHQRILLGVRLQQVAGRDRKVDIKPFTIQGLPAACQPTQLLTEILADQQARVLSLPELKNRLEAMEGVQFKQFNSITDYHSLMFDLGVIPKRLRSAADRSKFYRLIEASLYGGISSAITGSLRDYLLPENSGVRKAFQDMEAALRENRMTLEAIRTTQSDRDLFKHLIAESTSYVAADYMRHINERRSHLDSLLVLRRDLFTQRKKGLAEQYHHSEIAKELKDQSATELEREADYEAANEQLNLVQSAMRQQEKIARYQEELEELSYRLEEQNIVVVEACERQAENEMRVEAAVNEVDELKSQLADYQQALDVQQTRAIQCQQAQEALKNARALCQLPELTADNAEHWLETFHLSDKEATATLLQLQQKLTIATASHHQFEQAYQLVVKISGSADRAEAWSVARELLRRWPSQQHLAERIQPLQIRLSELRLRLQAQQDAESMLQAFCQRQGKQYQADELVALQLSLEQQIGKFEHHVSQVAECRIAMRQQLDQFKQEKQRLITQAPIWLAAQEALNKLSEQNGAILENSDQVSANMQQWFERERKVTLERDKIAAEIRSVETQIERLNQPSGAEDPRLVSLAEYLGGVLLSEIYDDIAVDDAPHYSALYGPARHGIVVPNLSLIRDKLQNLAEAPDDLYLIEGDPQSFDEDFFTFEAQEKAILVRSADRQWRYSRYPDVPLFGRVARENRCKALCKIRDDSKTDYATLSFDMQKAQRIHQAFSCFVASHLSVVFDADPEEKIRLLTIQCSEIENNLRAHEEQHRQHQQQFEQTKAAILCLNKLVPLVSLLRDDSLQHQIEEITADHEQALQAAHYIKQQGASLAKLEPLLAALQNDPQQHQQLQDDYSQAQQQQHLLKKQIFSLSEVVQRRAHFNYADSTQVVTESTDLNDQLRQRLAQAETERSHAREQLRQYQTQFTQNQHMLASFKSAYEAKNDLLRELEQELKDIGVQADSDAQARALRRRDELQTALRTVRLQRNQLEKKLICCEAEIEDLEKKQRKSTRDYHQMRAQIVQAKSGWCRVMRMVKDNGVERHLHRRELAYKSADELRSMSDKALGALRPAVAENEYLRDLLRSSEDAKRPERKIVFYSAVYQHLRERIRQDILRTDDPIDAIEQMEIELARLTEELNAREHILAISCKSVANIIRKTIQREQNRILMLNQGLRAVSFGQVKSVRLNVNVREAHATLLAVLSEQQEQHQDLFNSNRLTFSEALAKLYQRLNPQLDPGQRSAQTIGEALLDYRNYLELAVEVYRGADGWLRAESGALSTGEAIGTGMSILVMVVQSWEEESQRLRGKDISPCRLLFLDEAARLDAKSIATLFELCARLEMQLIIAAPENISPEKGTTYKLVRKVFNRHEHVHVVGLRGFVNSPPRLAVIAEEE